MLLHPIFLNRVQR